MGKDLYQHLAKIYSEEARYCILFASKEYAEKVWTNHELRNAQVRALKEKGAEYILPVRFDDTKVPGLANTVGYLDYHVEGAKGIAQLALEKIGKVIKRSDSLPVDLSAASELTTQIKITHSTRAYIECANPRIALISKITDSAWGNKIELTIEPDGSFEEAQLTKLRSASEQVIVSFGYDVAVARVENGSRRLIDGKALWSFVFNPVTTSFRNHYEFGIGTKTSDQFSQQRAERLLLNSHPQPDYDQSETMAFASQSMVESAIRGVNALTEVTEGAAPKIWDQFRTSPGFFLKMFWQRSVAQLILSNTVEFIDYFSASLENKTLHVDFKGQRHKAYTNRDPFQIVVEGKLALE